MEVNDQLEKKGKRAEVKKPDRFQCPECGKRCDALVRDQGSDILSRLICEDCYEKQNK